MDLSQLLKNKIMNDRKNGPNTRSQSRANILAQLSKGKGAALMGGCNGAALIGGIASDYTQRLRKAQKEIKAANPKAKGERVDIQKVANLLESYMGEDGVKAKNDYLKSIEKLQSDDAKLERARTTDYRKKVSDQLVEWGITPKNRKILLMEYDAKRRSLANSKVKTEGTELYKTGPRKGQRKPVPTKQKLYTPEEARIGAFNWMVDDKISDCKKKFMPDSIREELCPKPVKTKGRGKGKKAKDAMSKDELDELLSDLQNYL